MFKGHSDDERRSIRPQDPRPFGLPAGPRRLRRCSSSPCRYGHGFLLAPCIRPGRAGNAATSPTEIGSKRDPEWICLRQFFVERGRRRNGIGREALRRLRAEFWKDAPRVRLDVLAGNSPGIAFWRAMGFQDYCLTMEKTS